MHYGKNNALHEENTFWRAFAATPFIYSPHSLHLVWVLSRGATRYFCCHSFPRAVCFHIQKCTKGERSYINGDGWIFPRGSGKVLQINIWTFFGGENRSFSNREIVSWNQQEFTAIYDKYKLQGEKLINFIRYTAGLQGR